MEGGMDGAISSQLPVPAGDGMHFALARPPSHIAS